MVVSHAPSTSLRSGIRFCSFFSFPGSELWAQFSRTYDDVKCGEDEKNNADRDFFVFGRPPPPDWCVSESLEGVSTVDVMHLFFSLVSRRLKEQRQWMQIPQNRISRRNLKITYAYIGDAASHCMKGARTDVLVLLSKVGNHVRRPAVRMKFSNIPTINRLHNAHFCPALYTYLFNCRRNVSCRGQVSSFFLLNDTRRIKIDISPASS